LTVTRKGRLSSLLLLLLLLLVLLVLVLVPLVLLVLLLPLVVVVVVVVVIHCLLWACHNPQELPHRIPHCNTLPHRLTRQEQRPPELLLVPHHLLQEPHLFP